MEVVNAKTLAAYGHGAGKITGVSIHHPLRTRPPAPEVVRPDQNV